MLFGYGCKLTRAGYCPAPPRRSAHADAALHDGE